MKKSCGAGTRMGYLPRRFPARLQHSALTTIKYRGVAQYGEKGWRSDEVGSPDSNLQRHGAVAQANRRRLRLAERRDQEEPEEQRPLHHARPAEDEGREEARDEGPRGNQPLHRREDDVQGQAGQQEGPRDAAEEPQGDGKHLRNGYCLLAQSRLTALWASAAV